jgi:predicted nucleic acid-binding protein
MGWVVSDSSTLIHLAVIGRFSLLQSLYQIILIPPAVWDEVVVQGAERPGANEALFAKQTGWLRIQAPKNTALVRSLSRDLDQGESEAIALAVEQNSDLLLIDEADGRKAASIYGLPKTGVIGVLIRSKKQGLVSSLREEFEHLENQSNFRIDPKLIQLALLTVGEKTSSSDG